MQLFVTGASGWIGSAVVPELLAAGHQVVGLARSDEAAARVSAHGAAVRRGDLEDVDGLRDAAAASDGVVHLGYHHDFSQMAQAAEMDAAAIAAFGDVLAGTDRPLLIASGVLRLTGGRVATEADQPEEYIHPRTANADATLALAERGVRSIVMRFSPTVHGPGDHGFVATLVDVARRRGVSAFVGEGTGRWPAVHVVDAAVLVRLAVEAGPAGSVFHAVAEEGVTNRSIAEAIGRGLGLPVTSVAPEDALGHFDWIGMFFGADVPASSAATRAQLGWRPTHQGLIADIDGGAYFDLA
jgi:nucleoside-diphosphate-sugar epimerase